MIYSAFLNLLSTFSYYYIYLHSIHSDRICIEHHPEHFRLEVGRPCQSSAAADSTAWAWAKILYSGATASVKIFSQHWCIITDKPIFVRTVWASPRFFGLASISYGNGKELLMLYYHLTNYFTSVQSLNCSSLQHFSNMDHLQFNDTVSLQRRLASSSSFIPAWDWYCQSTNLLWKVFRKVFDQAQSQSFSACVIA